MATRSWERASRRARSRRRRRRAGWGPERLRPWIVLSLGLHALLMLLRPSFAESFMAFMTAPPPQTVRRVEVVAISESDERFLSSTLALAAGRGEAFGGPQRANAPDPRGAEIPSSRLAEPVPTPRPLPEPASPGESAPRRESVTPPAPRREVVPEPVRVRPADPVPQRQPVTAPEPPPQQQPVTAPEPVPVTPRELPAQVEPVQPWQREELERLAAVPLFSPASPVSQPVSSLTDTLPAAPAGPSPASWEEPVRPVEPVGPAAAPAPAGPVTLGDPSPAAPPAPAPAATSPPAAAPAADVPPSPRPMTSPGPVTDVTVPVTDRAATMAVGETPISPGVQRQSLEPAPKGLERALPLSSPAGTPHDPAGAEPAPSVAPSPVAAPLGTELEQRILPQGDGPPHRPPTVRPEGLVDGGAPVRSEGTGPELALDDAGVRLSEGHIPAWDVTPVPDDKTRLAPTPHPSNRQPQYPESLKGSGLEGLVLVQIQVDEEGKVIHWQIANSRGHRAFIEAVAEVVETWRFSVHPAWSLAGRLPPVVTVPVIFREQQESE